MLLVKLKTTGLYNTLIFFLKISDCNCNTYGSNGTACNSERQCNCKENFKGLTCNTCNHEYFGFPACQSCQCHPNGSVNLNCDANGRCSCFNGYIGDKCNACAYGYSKDISGACVVEGKDF